MDGVIYGVAPGLLCNRATSYTNSPQAARGNRITKVLISTIPFVTRRG